MVRNLLPNVTVQEHIFIWVEGFGKSEVFHYAFLKLLSPIRGYFFP